MNAKQPPLVSIVVPVYKTELYLDQCVQSLLSQTYQSIEIILVDDGSPDSCPALCDAYAKKYKQIRVIHKENEGAAFARKAGLDLALGEYTLFLDSDDWLDADTVSACVSVAQCDAADCVMFGYVREYPDSSIQNPLFEQDFSYDQVLSEQRVHRRIVGIKDEELQEPHRIDNLSSFGMRLFRTAVARRGRFISERKIGTSEDTIFNLYALDGCRISYINRYFYHYRKNNAQSITASYKPNLSDKWDIMYRMIQEYIDGSGQAADYHTPFLNRVACGMIGLGLNEISSRASIWQKAHRLKGILNKPLYVEAFAQLDISYCGFKWKLFFLLCKGKAALPLTVLLQIMNYLRSRVDG